MRPNAPPIWFLALTTASPVLGLTILTPALPLIKQELQVSSNEVQLLLTVFMVSLAVGQLIHGPLSDRWGRRPVLIAGAILFSLGSIAAIFTSNIDLLIVCRGIQGFGAAACSSMGRAMVNDSFERSEAARQMSSIAMVLAIVPALSIAFGGILADIAGLTGAMILMSVAATFVVITTLTRSTETNLNPTDRIDALSIIAAYRSVLGNLTFVCWTLSSGLQIGMFFSLNAFLGYQFARHGYSMAEFGLWFSLTPIFYLIGNSCNRKWFVAKGLERASMIGCTLSLISVVSLFLTQKAGFTHALSLAIPLSLFGFGNGIVVANSMVGSMSAAGRHAGTGSGILGAWQMASGGIAGAIIIALGGAEIFSVAATGLIIMALISVASMYVVYNRS